MIQWLKNLFSPAPLEDIVLEGGGASPWKFVRVRGDVYYYEDYHKEIHLFVDVNGDVHATMLRGDRDAFRRGIYLFAKKCGFTLIKSVTDQESFSGFKWSYATDDEHLSRIAFIRGDNA